MAALLSACLQAIAAAMVHRHALLVTAATHVVDRRMHMCRARALLPGAGRAHQALARVIILLAPMYYCIRASITMCYTMSS